MKKITILCFAVVLMFAFSSCEKNDSDCALVPAKILRYDCDRVIFQILSSDFTGDANWVDVSTGQQYSNVVSYYNTCKISELTNGEKTTIYVEPRLMEQNNAAPCYQCLAVSPNPPQIKVDFRVIATNPCSNSSRQ
jgi:hypothetical protein